MRPRHLAGWLRSVRPVPRRDLLELEARLEYQEDRLAAFSRGLTAAFEAGGRPDLAAGVKTTQQPALRVVKP